MELSLLDSQENQSVKQTAAIANSAPSNEVRRALRRRTLLILVGVWAISAVYMAVDLNRGWVPHDEGTYAQSAERVLGGELPHRDFDDLYTGGLSFLNAFAFRVLGTNLGSLRLVLMVFFLAWVPTIFYIASRFGSAFTAGAITLLAVAWSLPNYAAAVPSWYNLFFTVFGAAAIFRYLETRRYRWVFLAGICGGFSILVKITGLYFIAAALLFFVFREQCGANGDRKPAAGHGRGYSVFVSAALLAFVAILSAMIRNARDAAYTVHFVVPGAALVAFLLWRESQKLPGNARQRFLSLFRMLVPFGIGISLPVAAYLIPYLRSNSLSSLVTGVFILPQQHLNFTVMRPADLPAAIATLLLVALIAGAPFVQGKLRWAYGGLIASLCVAALIASAQHAVVYRLVWNSLSFSIPVTVMCGIVSSARANISDERSALLREQLVLLLCVTAVWSVVQFPFSAPIYFCFVAPVLVLTLLAFFSSLGRAPRFELGVLLCFYLLFAVLRVTPSFIYHIGFDYQADTQNMPLTLPRAGGLRVEVDDALMYESVIPLMQEHAAGQYTYAAPDCPEIYFLSGLKNPTRTLFDFFDDANGRTQRILSAIERNQVHVIAISKKPSFSPPLAMDLRVALNQRFPQSTTIGRFEVRWRE
jgi:hypothetical protein